MALGKGKSKKCCAPLDRGWNAHLPLKATEP